MTGPEIWEQTSGKVDAVTFSTGTGGTLAGCLSVRLSVHPSVCLFVTPEYELYLMLVQSTLICD